MKTKNQVVLHLLAREVWEKIGPVVLALATLIQLIVASLVLILASVPTFYFLGGLIHLIEAPTINGLHRAEFIQIMLRTFAVAQVIAVLAVIGIGGITYKGEILKNPFLIFYCGHQIEEPTFKQFLTGFGIHFILAFCPLPILALTLILWSLNHLPFFWKIFFFILKIPLLLYQTPHRLAKTWSKKCETKLNQYPVEAVKLQHALLDQSLPETQTSQPKKHL